MPELAEIILAEDDKLDQKSIKRACRDLNILNPIKTVENGEEALAYLKSLPRSQSPCLILLDINMPKMNGIEFLKARESISEIKIIPVVVLTTSKEEADLVESYKLGVAGYMEKPIDYRKFVEVVRIIHLYWSLSLKPKTRT